MTGSMHSSVEIKKTLVRDPVLENKQTTEPRQRPARQHAPSASWLLPVSSAPLSAGTRRGGGADRPPGPLPSFSPGPASLAPHRPRFPHEFW